MKHRSLLLVMSVLSLVSLGSATCTQVFSALSIGGVQYPAVSTQNYPPPVVAGVVPLNVQFSTAGGSVVGLSGVSLIYTIDNLPVGPALTDNFAWSLNTSNFADGTHSLSVQYVDEPEIGYPCYTLVGRQYAFVVSNSGQPITGAQVVPVISPPAAYGPVLPQHADFVTYGGAQSHAAPHPFPYQFIPPTGGVTPEDLWIEPLLHSTSASGEGAPAFWRLSNGSIAEDALFTVLLGCDDLRKPAYGFDVLGPSNEQRKSHFDGLQDDVGVSSYTTFTANLDGPGFYGVSMEGRLLKLNMDGSVQTLAGWSGNRQNTPFHYLDSSIPMSQVQSRQTLIGNFDTQFYFPTDLAIDPNNHQHIFVADMNNHRIALVDLSKSPPVISTYAGVPGQSGYLNGVASTSLFNQPSSIAIAPDDTIYVADAENAAIRKIDPLGNVTTLVGLGPTHEPPPNLVAQAPLVFAPRAATPFSNAFINYPNTLRFDSKGNLVLAETVTQTIRYINLSAQTVTTLAQFTNTGSGFGEQVWLDVDRNGNVGQKDDIIATMVAGGINGLYRVPITGTTSVPLPTITTHATFPLYSGHTGQSAMPWTTEPWSVAIDDQEGRMVVSGVRSAGVVSLRLVQSSDPAFKLNLQDYAAGKAIWLSGTVPNFPFGSRPSFAAVHGFEGHSGLGSVLNFDDMVSMTDAQLGAYLQAGAEGTVPRPELTGDDLRNVIYYVRRTAMGGSTVVPGPSASNQTPTIVSSVEAVQSGSTSAAVTWTTSEPTLGFVNWGTTSGEYFGWSPIETGYSTSHSVSLTNLAAGDPIYLVVRAKDQAGNQSVSSEQTLKLH